ncbi:alpha/beta hydrolase [Roseomonas gilardii subsp. gilardii]|uniref:alpha/beta hydrolase n=1 Tax=Roseomonas gilardii TaxID=257708 RepID=UPI001FFBAFDA|nr:alpha/beta hydrolase [Roseomonas gilardii]UPG73433.1 alpha/beta hydrolase [Roseomonas gilardii subsp. gilardii]
MSDLSSELAPEMRALAERVAAEDGPQPDTTTLPPAEGRALAARLAERWNRNLPAMAEARWAVVPADPALGTPEQELLVLRPEQARPGAILFVHGGGFAFCDARTHERCARGLAIASGLPVILPNYHLAPEHPFPAGLRDVVAARRRAFAASGLPEGPLLLAGDSAGANLALASELHEQAAGESPAAALLLFYGVTDADFGTESYTVFADGPGLTRAKMQRYWNFYVADWDRRRDPLVAPLHAPEAALRNLPPMHLMAAGIDPLLSDTLNFAARLRALGRAEEATVVPGVVHGFLQMSEHLPQAREAIAAAGAFARQIA